MGALIFVGAVIGLMMLANWYGKKKKVSDQLPSNEPMWIVIGSAPDTTVYPPLDAESATLKDELINIGRCENHSDKFDYRGYPLRSSWLLGRAKPRAREIGQRLFDRGGNDLMLQVHGEVARALKGHSGRELELAWDGIGEWQG